MRKSVWVALVPGAIFISLLSFAAFNGYRLNTTSSLPLGIWQVVPVEQAAYVEFCTPEPFAELVKERGYLPLGACPRAMAPLLKPVAAVAGSMVEIEAEGLSVDGQKVLAEPIRNRDSAGRKINPMPQGKYLVQSGEIWVLSTYHPGSLDSRFYGPVKLSEVLSGMRPVYVLNVKKEEYALVYR